ncbi:MAG TPA: zinc ABC transporter substrate-binding protein [Amaricoccus sp.]|nr:zinc ABC transporter substrate-binding protein [Amaricoccus sp.]
MPLPSPALPAALLVCALAAAAPAAPRVAADIAPVQSIAARVMDGVGEPGLILPPGASPHGHALRPSEARLLQQADLVVWVGPALTPWLADPIATLAPQATLLTLAEAPGVTTLPLRAGGPFEAHADDDAHSGQPDAAAPAIDGHLWLDPANAVAAARAIAAALAAADPPNAAAYAANADGFAAESAALSQALDARLAPLRGRPFIVFHDGYQYFEHAFGLPAAGSVALHDGDAPGTARVAAIRDRVRGEGVVCAFAEPEFEPRLLATAVEGSPARLGELDGLGTGIAPGPDLYPALLRGLADGLEACLAP